MIVANPTIPPRIGESDPCSRLHGMEAGIAGKNTGYSLDLSGGMSTCIERRQSSAVRQVLTSK